MAEGQGVGIINFMQSNSGMVGQITNFIIVVVVILVLAALVWLFMYLKSFNIRVLVYDVKNNSFKLRMDKAKKKMEDNVMKLILLKTKTPPIKLPSSAQVYQFKHNDFISLARSFGGEFKYLGVNVKPEGAEMVESSPDSRFWEMLTYRKMMDRFGKTNWLQTWMPVLGMGIMILFNFILFFFLFKELETIVTGLSGVAGSISNACSCHTATYQPVPAGVPVT